MKTIMLTLLFCCLTALHTQAADEPLIPTPLNEVLLKIPGLVLSTSGRLVPLNFTNIAAG